MTQHGVSRRMLLLGATGCVAAGMAAFKQPDPSSHTSNSSSRLLVDPRSIVRGTSAAPAVSLTFDDGPDPRFTPRVLEILEVAGVTATFFLIGRNARAHPDLVERIGLAGHEIANHSEDHLWMDDLPDNLVYDQIRAGEEAISSYSHGLWFRPPRGWTSPAVAAECERQRLRSVFWTGSFESQQSHGVAVAARRVVASAQGGSIILCHDGGFLDGPNPQNIDRSRTVAALPRIIEGIRGKGLELVTVAEQQRHASR